MANLFLFAIGGTGSRVVKALTFLLGAGVKPASGWDIVPIIIDPHRNNQDVQRTISLLEKYHAIRAVAGGNNNFFATKIETLKHLDTENSELESSYVFDLENVSGKRFKEYIDYSHLEPTDQGMVDLIFGGQTIDEHGRSTDLVNIPMDIGFIGNPNIGTVVLNQLKNSKEFKSFANVFGKDDRIFLISSIFGGTGAAGFPTLVKVIRNATNEVGLDNANFLKEAKIGALSVLPYFNIAKEDESPIQKAHFIEKSKSALGYYEQNVNNQVNALYYLYDDADGKPLENDPGHGGQKNDAHVIELFGALAILDFLDTPDSSLEKEDGGILATAKEFMIDQNTDNISFSSLYVATRERIETRLSQMKLMKRFIDKALQKNIEGKVAWTTDKLTFQKSFLHEKFMLDLNAFLNSFNEWIKEMEQHSRAFKVFESGDVDLQQTFTDRHPKKSIFGATVSFEKFTNSLNGAAKKDYPRAETKFLAIFDQATNELFKKFEHTR